MPEHDERVMATPATVPVVADPAPLGLAGFALTTFVLSAHNANLGGFGDHGNAIVIGLANFYGGLGQVMAGMWAFRNRNKFDATALSRYGAFWSAVETSLLLALLGKIKAENGWGALWWFF